MITKRSGLIYALLLATWAVILGWQTVEHFRVRKAARATLINRAKDISNTLGLVIRSQRRFGGVISRERMETVLKDLIRPGELNSIALLNAAGDVVAVAGEPIDLELRSVPQGAEQWEHDTVTLLNLVDLGTNVTQDLQAQELTIVVPRHDLTNRPPPSPDRERTSPEHNNAPDRERKPPSPPDFRSDPAPSSVAEQTNAPSRGPGRGRFRGFGRPPWMSEEEYKSLIQKAGVHSFAIVMSTQPLLATMNHDLWLRGVIITLAGVSVVGFGLAWRNIAKSSELQIRLVRAAELTSHLKEMNLAAAGLAHETRNPLNIIRGLAQMISRQGDASPEVRQKSREITDEVDRVTGQLNEFINYSKPREVRLAPIQLGTVASEVVRTLGYDIDEKRINLQVAADKVVIEADEQLLRQALFNLVLNAIQAVGVGGEVQIRASRNDGSASLEVRDNGPGVPADHRAEIFKPYFTTNQKGTGLGLAVVQQIVLAHGWEIKCRSNEPKGAIFRIDHLKVVNKA
jgi:signal transduction histidine kinase